MNIIVNGIHTQYIQNIHHINKSTVNNVINKLFHDSDYQVTISDVGRTLLQENNLKSPVTDWNMYDNKSIFT